MNPFVVHHKNWVGLSQPGRNNGQCNSHKSVRWGEINLAEYFTESHIRKEWAKQGPITAGWCTGGSQGSEEIGIGSVSTRSVVAQSGS